MYELLIGGGVAAALLPRARARLRLSRAKHPSLAGHVRMARRLARLLPYYALDDSRAFAADGAPADVAERRRGGLLRLSARLRERAPRTLAATAALAPGVSDLQFISSYRVPYPFRELVLRHLPTGAIAASTAGVTVTDLDGNTAYDVGGSYGLNVFGYDFYKACIDAAVERARALGPVLGVYHPLVEENVRRLRAISQQDEVSFHMSGTEAVMQAVRLARYHTGRSHAVLFTGAYHGWWDGVQPGVGNPRPVPDAYVLRDMSPRTLDVLRSRHDVACVLVNPLQMLHPNAGAPGDGSLVSSAAPTRADRAVYTEWLRALRDVCTARGIVLIFDEVFLGFRLAAGGAQEYFGVRADMVTYGKTVGGGLPVGVLCGRADLMKRFRDERPADVCFARGTFNAHPYVMAAMYEFLHRIDTPEIQRAYAEADDVWNRRAAAVNDEMARRGLPVRVENLVSVWTIRYTQPCRYNWMLQYYLRAHGLSLGWVGSGRLIFGHNYTDQEFAAVAARLVAAAAAMADDGWWWNGHGLTDAAIRRLALREALGVAAASALTRLRAARPGRRGAPAAGAAARRGTA